MTMKLYGFWRSLATYRVRVALALKGLKVEELSINLLQGKQHDDNYRAVNPQSVVPALVIDDGPPLFQSLAIIEYLEETYPEPPLLPQDARGRARVRGLSMIVACDGHPLIVPRIRTYLEREMHEDEAARNRWLQHWTLKAVEALEAPRAAPASESPPARAPRASAARTRAGSSRCLRSSRASGTGSRSPRRTHVGWDSSADSRRG